MKTVSITVKGKVQGVFYRQTAKEKALDLGITGKVMNLPNGDVHVIASGQDKMIDQFIDWCRQGPSKANVTGLEIRDLPDEVFSHFQIVRF
jgi:acylphosphatase